MGLWTLSRLPSAPKPPRPGSPSPRCCWDAPVFIACRIVGGLAIGAASVLAPMYISEIAPAHLRGRLASLQQMAIVLGLFGAFLSNYIIARIAGGAGAALWLGE